MVIDGGFLTTLSVCPLLSRQTYSMCGISYRAAVLATIPRVWGLEGPKIAATPFSRRSQTV